MNTTYGHCGSQAKKSLIKTGCPFGVSLFDLVATNRNDLFRLDLESVNLDVDENVSKEKFLKLNDYEVQQPETTEQELWIGLNSVGFNYAMELDMVRYERCLL